MIWVLTKQLATGGSTTILHAFTSVEKLQEYKTKHKLTNKTIEVPRYIYLVEKIDLD